MKSSLLLTSVSINTTEYVNDLLEDVILRVSGRGEQPPDTVIPPALASTFTHPDKDTAVQEHRSRFQYNH